MFEFILKKIDKETVSSYNKKNKSITFNENFIPEINSHYTNNRFTPSEKEISDLEKRLPTLFLESQKIEIIDFIKNQKKLTEKLKKKATIKYLKIVKSESKKLKTYNKFYYGYVTRTGEKQILIQTIDFSSINNEGIKNIKNRDISKLLFKNEWNSYGGIVFDTFFYNIKNKRLTSQKITSRITQFWKVECEVIE